MLERPFELSEGLLRLGIDILDGLLLGGLLIQKHLVARFRFVVLILIQKGDEAFVFLLLDLEHAEFSTNTMKAALR